MSDSKPSTPKRETPSPFDRVRVIKNEFFDPSDTDQVNKMNSFMAGKTCTFNPSDQTISFDDTINTTVFRLQMVERAPSRREKAKE